MHAKSSLHLKIWANLIHWVHNGGTGFKNFGIGWSTDTLFVWSLSKKDFCIGNCGKEQFYLFFFLRRPIINLKELNKYIPDLHSQMVEGLEIPSSRNGTQLYTDDEFKCPAGAFPGNVQDLIRESLKRLRIQVRGGLCGKAGGHIEEYHWRYFAMHRSVEDMKDDFLVIIRSRCFVYRPLREGFQGVERLFKRLCPSKFFLCSFCPSTVTTSQPSPPTVTTSQPSPLTVSTSQLSSLTVSTSQLSPSTVNTSQTISINCHYITLLCSCAQT